MLLKLELAEHRTVAVDLTEQEKRDRVMKVALEWHFSYVRIQVDARQFEFWQTLGNSYLFTWFLSLLPSGAHVASYEVIE